MLVILFVFEGVVIILRDSTPEHSSVQWSYTFISVFFSGAFPSPYSREIGPLYSERIIIVVIIILRTVGTN